MTSDYKKPADYFDQKYNDKVFWYIRLGAFLDFIQNEIMYVFEVNTETTPILYFDTEIETNLMFIQDAQVSTNPGVCLINRKLTIEKTEYYFTPKDANPFESTLIDNFRCYGKIMNIYLNMKWILITLDELRNPDTNKVVLIQFLNTILSAINSSLGGTSKLETNLDETTNTIIIRDANPLPNKELVITKINEYYKNKAENTPDSIARKISMDKVTFDLYGYKTEEPYPSLPVYDGKPHASFIKDFNFRTEITPALSTMLTVGATANSTVVGENSTAFSKFNRGLEDRFKQNISSPLSTPISSTEEKAESTILFERYAEIYINYLNYLTRNIGYSVDNVNPKLSFSGEQASTYRDALTNFTTYLQQANQKFFEETNEQLISEGKNPITPPSSIFPGTGFIPFNLSITMDGLSGMKIYNQFNIDTNYLPANYPNYAEFIIKNMVHTIENNKWYTKLESIIVTNAAYTNPKTSELSPLYRGGSNTPRSPLETGKDADLWSLVAICAAENYISNSQGMADVAQSIYNRLGSKAYGNDIKSIVVAKNQYEPTFYNIDDWYKIKDKNTAVIAYQNSRKVSKGIAIAAIDTSLKAITNSTYQQNAQKFVGSRTEFYAGYEYFVNPPSLEKGKARYSELEKAGQIAGAVKRAERNNLFFWRYSGKTLLYNKNKLNAFPIPNDILDPVIRQMSTLGVSLPNAATQPSPILQNITRNLPPPSPFVQNLLD